MSSFLSYLIERGSCVGNATAAAPICGAQVGGYQLTPFEADVLETLQLDGPIGDDPVGGQTLCEQFGYPNGLKEELHRALRQLIKLGLVRQLDGQHNAMRNIKRLRFSKQSVTAYQAV